MTQYKNFLSSWNLILDNLFLNRCSSCPKGFCSNKEIFSKISTLRDPNNMLAFLDLKLKTAIINLINNDSPLDYSIADELDDELFSFFGVNWRIIERSECPVANVIRLLVYSMRSEYMFMEEWARLQIREGSKLTRIHFSQKVMYSVIIWMLQVWDCYVDSTQTGISIGIIRLLRAVRREFIEQE